MFKKIIIVFALLIFFSPSVKGQPFHVKIDYHSFEPYIHFQLDFGNHHRFSRSYRRAYFKGYMDGVNNHYRYDHRYRSMVRVKRAYEAGYRDGYRDRGLILQIRGRNWLRRHRFTQRDYYSPSYAVRVWLDNVTLAFIKAPVRRLPPGWRRKVHPRVRRYRARIHHRRRYRRDYEEYEREDDYEDYYEEYYEEYEEDD